MRAHRGIRKCGQLGLTRNSARARKQLGSDVVVVDSWRAAVASGRMDSVPIHENGDVIGAIGVSGAARQEDVACAEAALSVLGISSNEHATPSFAAMVSFEMTKQRHVAPDKRPD